MKHKLLKLLSSVLLFALIVAICLFYAIYISPDKLTIKYETLTSKKIPKSLDDVTIGYFSDVYYLEFMDDKRLDTMIQKINDTDVDILLFGGDLFSNPSDPIINADIINNLTTKLANINAPLGKFYVLGEKDNMTPDTKTLVSNILYNAGFEDMSNRNIKLHNGNNESITLIGLDNSINGIVDIQGAFNGTSSDSYSIMFTHTPNNINELAEDNLDVAIAGHSLGGQIYLPIIGLLTNIEGATKYYRGNYTNQALKIIISNGLGTTKSDMRLFTPPQFNVFQLNHSQ